MGATVGSPALESAPEAPDTVRASTPARDSAQFRWFSAKNDLARGDFDGALDRLCAELAAADTDKPTMKTRGRAVVASQAGEAALADLRLRMTYRDKALGGSVSASGRAKAPTHITRAAPATGDSLRPGRLARVAPLLTT